MGAGRDRRSAGRSRRVGRRRRPRGGSGARRSPRPAGRRGALAPRARRAAVRLGRERGGRRGCSAVAGARRPDADRRAPRRPAHALARRARPRADGTGRPSVRDHDASAEHARRNPDAGCRLDRAHLARGGAPGRRRHRSVPQPGSRLWHEHRRAGPSPREAVPRRLDLRLHGHGPVRPWARRRVRPARARGVRAAPGARVASTRACGARRHTQGAPEPGRRRPAVGRERRRDVAPPAEDDRVPRGELRGDAPRSRRHGRRGR